MEAERLFYSREALADGSVLELRLWRVPQPVPPSIHRFKYALFYGRPGARLVLFDNERGKGDHMHIRGGSDTLCVHHTGGIGGGFHGGGSRRATGG